MNVGTVCESLDSVISTIEDTITEARGYISKGTADKFVSERIGCLAEVIECYGSEMKKLGITKREELDNFMKQNFSSSDKIFKKKKELDKAEKDWHSFLKEVDTDLTGYGSSPHLVKVGDELDLDSDLIDLDTGEAVSVKESLKCGQSEFGDSVRFVFVSYGPLEGIRRWREEVKCTYKMYTNPSRSLYQYVGVPRSIYKHWSIGRIMTVAEQIAEGKPLGRQHADFTNDPHQLGGDFVLNKDGHFLMLHRSSNPKDRPTVDQLIALCNQ